MPHLLLPGGHRLAYVVEGAGPPLVLISGLGGKAAFWDRVAPRLARRFTVIRHDQLGTGASDAPLIDYSIDQMAGDVLALMDALGVERAHVVGHSTGGAIAQTLALDAPARVGRLVLSATWTRADRYLRLLFETRAEVLRRAGGAVYGQLSALLAWPTGWLRERGVAPELTVTHPDVLLRRIDALLRFDRVGELGRIAAPTLVIVARDDRITPPYFSHALGALIPGARVVVAPGGGHFLPRSAPRVFLHHVQPFLDGEEGRARSGAAGS
ncbi:MAG: alpha/beta fold hydrolase [Rhodospirillaceae bacterium]|nr:alpha/beta fold hydrolase [Rhodospirillaceae bacterium]